MLLQSPGAVWLLSGVSYPGNAGFVIRTAEVSGAAGIILDARFDRIGRRSALRVSMRSDWFMPVCWERSETVVERAASAGRRLVGIEDCGGPAPWEADLTGRVLFVVGAERGGIPSAILARCEPVVRVPMAGFLPTYNLQAAVAAVAVERLRQLAVRGAT
jgi:TrmH family RNA methyltransferase